MRVLIACEYSGITRDAFRRRGHDAISCDILPTETPGPHIQGDVTELLDEPYDLVIAHPPCTYLSNAGVAHLYTDETRWEKMLEGVAFFNLMQTFNAPKICVENPMMHGYAQRRINAQATQYIHPYMFGEMYSKRTGLWLTGLPTLTRTIDVYPLISRLPYRQRAYHEKHRGSHKRSKSFVSIANAMAEQWG